MQFDSVEDLGRQFGFCLSSSEETSRQQQMTFFVEKGEVLRTHVLAVWKRQLDIAGECRL